MDIKNLYKTVQEQGKLINQLKKQVEKLQQKLSKKPIENIGPAKKFAEVVKNGTWSDPEPRKMTKRIWVQIPTFVKTADVKIWAKNWKTTGVVKVTQVAEPPSTKSFFVKFDTENDNAWSEHIPDYAKFAPYTNPLDPKPWPAKQTLQFHLRSPPEYRRKNHRENF